MSTIFRMEHNEIKKNEIELYLIIYTIYNIYNNKYYKIMFPKIFGQILIMKKN